MGTKAKRMTAHLWLRRCSHRRLDVETITLSQPRLEHVPLTAELHRCLTSAPQAIKFISLNVVEVQ